MRTLRCGLAALAIGATATLALAFTVPELQARASALASTYDSLSARAENCPAGKCIDRPAIEADRSEAEAARLELHADRQALNPCSTCAQLDSKLAMLDSSASTLGVVIDGWDEQG
jgi:hypothetical protein